MVFKLERSAQNVVLKGDATANTKQQLEIYSYQAEQ